MIIDIHTHFFPQELIDRTRNHDAIDGLSIIIKGDKEFVQHRQGARYPLAREFHNLDAKLEKMSALEIDISILSAAPTLFMYWLDENEGSEFCAWMNDRLAEFILPSAGKLFGLAAVPLQDPVSAIGELQRAILELKFSGVQIGTSMESIPLDDHSFDPFFKEANRLGSQYSSIHTRLGRESEWRIFILTT
jgi:aminocarboxymuconate-semialdehyde decarboxylase